MTKIAQKPNVRTNQSLERYLQEIGEVGLLMPEEEIRLARCINYKPDDDPGLRKGKRPKFSRKQQQTSLDKLVKANLRFVVSVAKQYQNQGLSLGDLINEGNLGLIKAAQRFDETRGFKFISYAVWWIRQSILQALAEQSRVVRLPLNRVGALNKIGKAYNTLEQEFEREPSPEEIAEELEMNLLEVTDTLKMSGRHLSIDAPFSQGEDNRLLDIIHNDMQPSPDSGLIDESLKIEVRRALATLTERESEVIKFYFGIEKEQKTLEEIGELFHLTRERVRQIKEKAIRKLNHPSRSKALKAYLS
jgi:RNA polymerase primary sigma factor